MEICIALKTVSFMFLNGPSLQQNYNIVIHTMFYRQVTFDGTSRLTVKLVQFAKYSGNTGGLCGFYDNDG